MSNPCFDTPSSPPELQLCQRLICVSTSSATSTPIPDNYYDTNYTTIFSLDNNNHQPQGKKEEKKVNAYLKVGGIHIKLRIVASGSPPYQYHHYYTLASTDLNSHAHLATPSDKIMFHRNCLQQFPSRFVIIFLCPRFSPQSVYLNIGIR